MTERIATQKLVIDFHELARFLVKAKKNAWAGNRGKVQEPQRPGFKEFTFREGDWSYRDSYAGSFCAPGQEIVRFQGAPIWAMSYDGGMTDLYQADIDFARQTFSFLKKALLMVNETRPFRGPIKLKENDWLYISVHEGNIQRFKGVENIFHKGEEVFRQDYIGGLVIAK